ncbi:uncharacterized protein BDV17DRAFT_248213 [Aspergillus undulatus]|uniref:uncharacterized protein n=1 Tax=Aspergillus undulatus TaxID=1810928 RepID=UPI003CCD8125
MTMAAITCHRHVSSGYDNYQAGNNQLPMHLAASSAVTSLYSAPEHNTDSSSSLAVPSLDIPSAAATDKPHPCHSLHITGEVYILSETDSVIPTINTSTTVANGMAGPPTPPLSDKLRTPKRKRTTSTPSTRSPGETRSSSRSTRRSGGHSRQSSLHSHRRTNTLTSLTPSVPDSPVRRENLLALHRESCRLFQENSTSRQLPSPPLSPRLPRTFSGLNTPPESPILESRRSSSTLRPRSNSSHNSSHQENAPVHHVEGEILSAESKRTQPTIIEWTSPSTRRREYKEIDRASSGVRGFWRRVAPRWCQFGNSRVPFYVEREDGKANYEGSVRRFRMDLPDEPEQARRGLKLKPLIVLRRSKTGLV